MAKPKLPPGYTARYRHERIYTSFEKGSPPVPHGGTTTVFIYDEDGVLAMTASANCHPRDNFSKRIGRDIALGRALHALDKRTVS